MSDSELNDLLLNAKDETIFYLAASMPRPERCEYCKNHLEVDKNKLEIGSLTYRCEKKLISGDTPDEEECVKGIVSYFLQRQIDRRKEGEDD